MGHNESSNVNGDTGVERNKRQAMQYQCIIILKRFWFKRLLFTIKNLILL